jgi:transposase
MARHRTHPIAFKRQIVQEFLAGEVSLQGLAKRNDICRNLIRVWVEKYERGEFDDEVEAANLLTQYEARIAALERMVGRLVLENELLAVCGKRLARLDIDLILCCGHEESGGRRCAERTVRVASYSAISARRAWCRRSTLYERSDCW